MIEEPYRWVEAIANRREYIEHQLAPGSPIAALGYQEGLLLFTISRERQKSFEIYDRIGLGAIGHPGDIERLRMSAIELASTEGFTRSAHDVSLRRLANYALSPALKAAFEQIYGAPYLARLLFAELGRNGTPNLFLRLDYDGSIRTNGGAFGRAFEDFGVLAGTNPAAAQMELFLREQAPTAGSLKNAVALAADAWAVGHLSLTGDEADTLPTAEKIAAHLKEQLEAGSIEVAVMENTSTLPMTWRSLPEKEIRGMLGER
jgi:proteasome alpha subunit